MSDTATDYDFLRTVIDAAVLAPSVHNSQPWRFHVRPGVIEVFADPSRALPAIDEMGRELHISCGAASALAQLAVRAQGRSCTLDLLPDASAPDLLARIRIGPPQPPGRQDRLLARALPVRHTDREPFDPRPVPRWLVEDLRGLAAAHQVWLRTLDDPEDRVRAAVLLARADEIQRADPGYREELAAWVARESHAPEGIPVAALPRQPVVLRGSSFRLREFRPAPESPPPRQSPPGTAPGRTPPQTTPPTPDEPAPPVAEHPLVVLLGTPSDTPLDWLHAGQALAKILLRSTAAGVSASPMTQVLEVPATRTALAGELRLLGYPQMLLRMGYGHGAPVTHRRPLDEVIAAS